MSCFRANPINTTPKMGELPRDRTKPVRPFSIAGIDYAGPFLIKDGKLRNRTYIKAYVCIYVCFVSRAVHIELVTDLSTDAFLNSLKRFVARRGMCTTLYSDNATNFKGANNEIASIMKNIHKDKGFRDFLDAKKIKWQFIPARTPHFGGIWEARSKISKSTFKKNCW